MAIATVASLGITTLGAGTIVACLSRDDAAAPQSSRAAVTTQPAAQQPAPPKPAPPKPTPTPGAAATEAPPTQPTPPPESPPAPAPTASPPEQASDEAVVLPALVAIATDQIPTDVGLDPQILGEAGFTADRDTLLSAINNSLRYLNTEKSVQDYASYPIDGITHDRVRRSLQRFKQLVSAARSSQALQGAVRKEFEFYRSTGQSGQNDAHFTGYFEPTYVASATKTAEYRYPLFAAPADLDTWPMPHPDRIALEGKDGLQAEQGPLKDLDFVWLKSRLEAFLVQVQGSAKLSLTDGSTMSVGYAGRTNYPYVSVGRELVNDGRFTLEELSLPLMLDFFRNNPQALDEYLPRNPRFVFFKKTDGAPPTGSLSVPVVAERSIATDKSLLPPGALAIMNTQIPYGDGSGGYVKRPVSRFVLDQDTGGAIKGAGRADLFVGSGTVAGDRAGLMNETGQLYYLMLKDGF